jgi:hypothetical protein
MLAILLSSTAHPESGSVTHITDEHTSEWQRISSTLNPTESPTLTPRDAPSR